MEKATILNEAISVKTPGFCRAILPRVNQVIKNKKLAQVIQVHVAKYIDKNSELLYDIGPTKQLVFAETDKEFLFTESGISPAEVKTALAQTRVIQKSWVVTNDPFNLLAGMLIYGFASEKQHKAAKDLMYFLGLKLYTSKFYRSFKFQPNYNVMRYTVNNLSDKFKLKQKGNLFDALADFMDTAYNTYVDKHYNIDDKALVTFINGLDTRIGSFVKGIATEFYPNSDANKYMNSDMEVKTDDTYITNDNHMYVISRASDKIATKLSTTGVDYTIIELSSGINKVNKISLRNAIEQIDRDFNRDQVELANNIVTMYVNENPEAKDSDVGTTAFYAASMDLYKRNNTVDPVLLKIKEIINNWINETSSKYTKSNRVATVNDFRRSIYMYYVLYITKYVK